MAFTQGMACFGIIPTMFKYDLIVPLGYACSCSQILRRAGLQLASFPWDWVGVPPPSERCRLICTGFKGWMNLEDLKWAGKNDTFGHEEVRNARTGLIIMHDFAAGKTIEEQYPAITAKYERRIARLDRLLNESRRVLLVHIETPVSPGLLPPEDCRKAMETMSAKYPGAKFDFLLVSLEPGRAIEDRVDETPLPGVRRIAFDFKARAADAPAYGIEIDMVANLLKREYSVRDYRTKDEIAAFRKARTKKRGQKLARKMDALGADTQLQYWLFRLRRSFRHALCHVGPSAVRARMRQHRYAQIVPLGMNCDVAFRFYCRWGFVDSSLFAWANAKDLATLTAALAQVDAIADGRFEVSESSRMWRHVDTGVMFHGRLNWDENTGMPQQTELDKDLADLRERLRHLAAKLHRYLENDEETLIVHRLADSDASAPDVAKRLSALEDAINRLGAKNWKLLVICQSADLVKMPPPSDSMVFRCVKAFNPMAKVTHKDRGDPVGWNAIFTEFAPARLLPKSHAFKFE